MLRKHRLAERLLADVIGLDWAYVHDEACRWEHVMSEQVERRVLEMLGNPTESPYGNPIPGLAELGDPAAPALHGRRRQPRRARRRRRPSRSTGVIRRLGEPVQFEPELLQQLQDAGVMPGATVDRRRPPARTSSSQVDGFGDGLELPNEVACTSSSSAEQISSSNLGGQLPETGPPM